VEKDKTSRLAGELTVARRAMACEFSLVFPAAGASMVEAGCAALDEVERQEELLSIYQEDSELSRLNRSAAEQPVRVLPEVYRFLRLAVGLSETTGGAFDPTAGALVKAWGFYQGPKLVPAVEQHSAALAASGFRNVRFDDQQHTVTYLRRGLEINPGAIGKGYAIDRAIRGIRRWNGTGPALMQGGQSSVLALGAPPDDPRGWTVAIGNPCRPDHAVACVLLRNRALGTSGAANQYFVHEGRRYGHILDPRTGYPAHKLLSATAVAASAAEADALSTAFYVLGVDGTREFLRTRPDLGAILIRPAKSGKNALDVIRIGAVQMEVLQ
jgi:thiamine biosynthesis lipoprotein